MAKRNIESIYPLSPQQQGMLLESAASGRPGLHVEQLSCVLEGRLDGQAFEETWRRLLDRHPLLRTGFVWKDQEQPLQVVFRHVDVPVSRHDLQGESVARQEERIHRARSEDRRQGFQLSKAPLMRVTLLRTGAREWHFVWTHHHILMDGWCRPLLLGEMFELYRALCAGERPSLAPAPRPYRDYVGWLQGRKQEEAKAFWTRELAEFSRPTLPGRPTESSESVSGESFSEHRTTLSVEETQALESFAREHHVTLNTLIQGAWAMLLTRYSGTQDVVFGITHAGRPEDLEGVERTVGLFISTLPLRASPKPSIPVRDWLRSLQARNTELREHGYVSSGQVHGWSDVPGRMPLYESLVVFENYPVDSRSLDRFSNEALRIQDVTSTGAGTRYAMTLLGIPGERLELVVVADRRRISDADAARVLRHLSLLLQRLVADPEQAVGTVARGVPSAEVPQITIPWEQKSSAEPAELPATPTEQAVAELFRELLGVETVGRRDSFLDLGGHSLMATRLAARLREAFQVDLPLRWLFEAPTVSELAGQIDGATKDSAAGEPRIPRVSEEGGRDFPLSFTQRQLWVLQQLEPENPFYNHTAGVRLRGRLSADALDDAVHEVLRRHQILRTVYAEVDGQPIQRVQPTPDWRLPRIDLGGLGAAEAERETRSLAQRDVRRPVDLSRGPVVRFYLLQRRLREHVILMTTHHIASDAWSEMVLVRELVRLYDDFARGRPSSLPELELQYLDFAHWQQQHFRGQVLEEELSFWRDHLGLSLPSLRLPTDRVRQGAPTYEGERVGHPLPKELSHRLVAFSRERGLTLFMTMFAAFGVLLYRMTGQTSLLIGTTTASRGRPGTEHLVGCFINTLPVRLDLSGNPRFDHVLRRVKKDSLEIFAHQDLPIETLIQELKLSRPKDSPSPFRVTFGVRNVPAVDPQAVDLVFEPLDLEQTLARLDLTLWVHETAEGLEVFWRHSTDIFDSKTIELLHHRYSRLLAGASAEPTGRIDSFEIRTESEQRLEQDREREWKQAQSAKLMRGRRRTRKTFGKGGSHEQT